MLPRLDELEEPLPPELPPEEDKKLLKSLLIVLEVLLPIADLELETEREVSLNSGHVISLLLLE